MTSAQVSAPVEEPAPALTRRGLMLIIASPSGAGKSTLSRALLQNDNGLVLSVSVTTRQRRASEVDGVHYRFISRAAFSALQADKGLLEWAEVHGNFYGTPREPVEAALAAGCDVLVDVDYQGTLQLYEMMRDDIVSVFILPPSASELHSRLIRRAEDRPDVILRRLATARVELLHWDKFDHVIVNEDLDRSFGSLKSILAAARLRRERLNGLEPFTQHLRQGLDAIIQAGAGDNPA